MTPERVANFWSRVDKSGECWIWTGCRLKGGYGQLGHPDGSGRQVRAHRLAWELSHGPIPAGLLVCHTCDNPPCVRPDHLFLGTTSDNVHDARAKGRAAIGERHGRAVLTEEDVRQARTLAGTGLSSAEVASRYGVSVTTMRYALMGKTWRHVA